MILKIGIGVVVAALVGWLIYAMVQEDNQCTASGGHMVTTGYIPVVVGKTIVMNPIVECEH